MAVHQRSVFFRSTTDTDFRAWGSSFGAAFTAVSLVKTADTGQIDWATVVSNKGVTGVEQNLGYEMFAFQDSLQATKPVFIKLEYGFGVAGSINGGYPAGPPSVWVTVGTATNGAGAFTGTIISTRQRWLGIVGGGYTNTTSSGGVPTGEVPVNCFGDGSSIVWHGGAQSTPQVTMGFQGSGGGATTSIGMPALLVVERSRNAVGVPNGDGVVVITTAWNSTGTNGPTLPTAVTTTSQFLSFTGAGVSPVGTLVPVAYPTGVWGTSVAGAGVYTYLTRIVTPKAQYGLGLLGTFKGDIGLGTTVQLSVLGTMRTYRSLAGIAGTSGLDNARSYVNSTVPSGALLMRWE